VPSLLPRPRTLHLGEGVVTWRPPLRLAADDASGAAAASFARDLVDAGDWRVEVVGPDADADVRCAVVADLGDEDYRLTVDDATTIEAGSSAGVAHALTTLRQLGPDEWWSKGGATAHSVEVERVVIEDGPSHSWRGVHLDVARHFFDVATVCRLIDQIAAHRLNRLHLHLNDDQGWRVEVPSWPRLTDVAAWRRSSPLGREEDGRDDAVGHGGYYRARDLEEIRAHAARRHVQVVPEIDLPGHAQAVLAAYPELGNGGERVEVWTRWGISEHVLNVSDEALAFAEEVVTHVAGLFPGSPVHIGGDECPTAEWARSDAAREVMVRHGFDDVTRLQGLFTTRLARVLRASGHDVVAWDEVLDADVPEGVVIAAWRSSRKGVEAAKRGLDVIMAPMQFLYFDWVSSDDVREPVAQTTPPHVTTWERVYGFSVIPPGLDASLHHHVRGAQAQLWTEYIATRDHLDYMAFPRLSAFAEVAWGTATSLEEFRPRLARHLGRLSAMGVAFRPLDPVAP
jgi:hexosaminidase